MSGFRLTPFGFIAIFIILPVTAAVIFVNADHDERTAKFERQNARECAVDLHCNCDDGDRACYKRNLRGKRKHNCDRYKTGTPELADCYIKARRG